MNFSKIKFFLILVFELLFLPFLCVWEEFKKKNVTNPMITKRYREPIECDQIFVNIHEWGGYKGERIKLHKSGKYFECGLKSQLNRFTRHKNFSINTTLTLSDSNKYDDLDKLRSCVDNMLLVSNTSFDFSGYKEFYELIKSKKNSYIILSNSSVNNLETDFLDGYIKYMEDNPEVGILGTSYATRCYQSLVLNNFRPHLQSFFLLTTIDVLKNIVKSNNNQFPGFGISHKLLLIREGEIRLSEIALELGYSLSVVLENGNVLKFQKSNFFDNCYRFWNSIPKGDMRSSVLNPNTINPIK